MFDGTCLNVIKNINTHPFAGTTQVSWYQKGITSLAFTEARDSEWQLHQLGQNTSDLNLLPVYGS